MSPSYQTCVVAIFLGLALPLPASAQETRSISGDDWLRARLGHAGSERKIERLRDQMRMLFAKSDVDGGGVAQKDHDLAERIYMAQQRTQRASQILQHDLDNDGKVTRQELMTSLGAQARLPIQARDVTVMPTEGQVAKILDALVAPKMTADANKDGILTLDEMITMSPDQRSVDGWRGRGDMVPLSLDANGDNTVSLEEFEQAVERVIGGLDTNSDGAISQGEADVFNEKLKELRKLMAVEEQKLRQAAELRKKVEACSIPKPSAGARIVVVGAYEGNAISTVSVGDADVEVTVASLDIEQGDGPLYVVATSYGAMIWWVAGATDRVERLVLNSASAARGSRAPRVGAVGLPRERVTVLPDTACAKYFTDELKEDGLQAVAEVQSVIGQKIDVAFGVYALSNIRLPGGLTSSETKLPTRRDLPGVGPSAGMWAEMLRYKPAGLVEINPSAVIANQEIRPFVVLPQEAGIAQLLDDGALEKWPAVDGRASGKSADDVVASGGRQIGTRPSGSVFRIVKKMRFPPGLAGAHGVRFILGKGVAMPEGSAGHSVVISEETGKLIDPAGEFRD